MVKWFLGGGGLEVPPPQLWGGKLKKKVSEKVGTVGELSEGKIMKKWGRTSLERNPQALLWEQPALLFQTPLGLTFWTMIMAHCNLRNEVKFQDTPPGYFPTTIDEYSGQLAQSPEDTVLGAMRQRKLGSHTPPCHRRMVITTLFSVLLAALQRRPVLYHTRWLLTVHWHWSSGHLGQLAPTTHPQCR